MDARTHHELVRFNISPQYDLVGVVLVVWRGQQKESE